MRIGIILIILALLLTACSGSAAGDADAIRDHYAAVTEADYRVTLRTDFGDRVIDFTVQYHQNADGGVMEILAPELIAGIKAELNPDGVTVRYDGLSLGFPSLPGTGLSPMESLPFILRQWRDGYVVSAGKEVRAGRELVHITHRTTREGATLETVTLFDQSTFQPITAELFVNGFCTVTALFEGT